MPIPWATPPVPAVTTAQMVEVDRLMIDVYGVTLMQMMENAGRNLAQLARERFLDGDPRGRRVVVLAGSGGNGGGALVAARRLYNYGAAVRVVLARPAAALAPVPRHQLDALVPLGVPLATAPDDPWPTAPVDLVLDGVIGYSLRGAPQGGAAACITWANAQNAPVLALDAPSGVDTTSGRAFAPAVRATATLTLALPKTGLLAPAVAQHVGELYLADISVPPALYAAPSLGLTVGPVFATSDIVRLR